MSVNGIDASANTMQPAPRSGLGSFIGTMATNTLLCTGVSAGIAKFTKLGEDEFVAIGSGMEKVKEGVKNTENIEEGLKAIFKSEEGGELVKLVKSAKIKSAAKSGAIWGAAFGVAIGIMDKITSDTTAKAQAKAQAKTIG